MASLSGRNIPLFILFRVLFNARWYYPILAIVFLDFGLSLEQYALLNVAWAISIVCLEVPSGAVADQIGRRKMVLLAAGLMVLEMVLFAFAPLRSAWLFPMLLLNRIFSGAAEASASGADESLAYDSLREDGREGEWPAVLARLARWQSAAFFVAMMAGAAVYDPAIVERVLHFVGSTATVSRETTMRWPLYLTLGNAVVAFLAVTRMREPSSQNPHAKVTVRETWRQVVSAARYIVNTPAVLLVILMGLSLDSVLRLFLTLTSKYFRLISFPDVSFGLIGSGLALLGFVSSPIAQRMVQRRGFLPNFGVVAIVALVGLVISAQFWPWWGLLGAVAISTGMSMLQFFLSFYLNKLVPDSSLRATVLSFKGLSFNLAYGAAGLALAAFTKAHGQHTDQETTFMDAIRWLPWVLAAILGLLAIVRTMLRVPAGEPESGGDITADEGPDSSGGRRKC